MTCVRTTRFESVRSADVLTSLAAVLHPRPEAEAAGHWAHRPWADGMLSLPTNESAIALPAMCDVFLAQLQRLLRHGDVLIQETMAMAFGLLPMRLPEGVLFITQALYGSIGFALPAAGGASRAAGTSQRVIVVTGDGSLHSACVQKNCAALTRRDCQRLTCVARL